VTDPWGGIECAWSPDGTKIAYTYAQQASSEEVITDVYVMNADGSGKTNLTSKQMASSPPGHPMARGSLSRAKGIVTLAIIMLHTQTFTPWMPTAPTWFG
jgi:hypothetical protein